MSDELVYKGRDNAIVRELTRDGLALSEADKGAITRVVAAVAGACLDTDGDEFISYSDGRVTLRLGQVEGLQAGRHAVRLTVFDPAHPEGLAWGSFVVNVIDWPVCS